MSVMSELQLPLVRFYRQPELEKADELAAEIARLAREAELEPTAEAVIRARGWRIDERRIGASEGELQALLCPLTAGGFAFVVDPDLTPAEMDADDDPQRVRALRLGHELGHVFFYTADCRRRLCGEWAKQPEEEWCDRFAEALLSIRPDSGAAEADVPVRSS
jgi:hypothetical protein